MAHRKKLIVGNWKMNFNIRDASVFVHKLSQSVKVHRDVEVVIAPTLLALQPISLQIERRQYRRGISGAVTRFGGICHSWPL